MHTTYLMYGLKQGTAGRDEWFYDSCRLYVSILECAGLFPRFTY